MFCNKIKNFTFFGNYDNINLVLNKLYKSFENQIFKIRACSSVDRAVVSGTTCRGFESLRVCYMLWGEHEDKGI